MALWEMLPIEIMIDILARLPQKIWFQLRIMFEQFSEQYYAITKSDDFMKLQVYHAMVNNNTLLWSSSLIFEAAARHLKTRHNIEFPDADRKWLRPKPNGCPENLRIESICNGLVLIAGYTSTCSSVINKEIPPLFLWNPATQKSEKLPPQLNVTENATGFGYDDKKDDFKVVQFIGWDAAVYSLSTGVWKLHEYIIPGFYYDYYQSIYINGFLFWFGVDEFEFAYAILSFDISKEVFSQVTMPPEFRRRDFSVIDISIGAYENDLLAIVAITTEHQIALWVEKDSDSSEHTGSWMNINWTNINYTLDVKRFMPNKYGHIHFPICFEDEIPMSH